MKHLNKIYRLRLLEFNLSPIVRKILESKSITQYDEINTLINGTNKKA